MRKRPDYYLFKRVFPKNNSKIIFSKIILREPTQFVCAHCTRNKYNNISYYTERII